MQKCRALRTTPIGSMISSKTAVLLTFDFYVGRSSLRIANPIGDFTRIESPIVRMNGADDQGTVSFKQSTRLEPRNRAHSMVFAKPRNAKVARKASSFTRHFQLVTLQSCNVQWWNNYNCPSCCTKTMINEVDGTGNYSCILFAT